MLSLLYLRLGTGSALTDAMSMARRTAAAWKNFILISVADLGLIDFAAIIAILYSSRSLGSCSIPDSGKIQTRLSIG